jgi:creatinine amidohydrolase
MHAGEIETSILLHAHPELVRDGYEAADWVADDRRHLLTTGMGEYTRSGVIGRAIAGVHGEGKGSPGLPGRQLRSHAGDPTERQQT